MIAWPFLAILAAYCLFWGGAWSATYDAELRVWALISAFAIVGAWIVVAVRALAWRPRTILAPAFALAFVAFTISTITSRFPRLSVEYLALAILLAALYLVLQRLMASDFFRPRMIGFATIAGILTGIAYIWAVVPHWVTWWGLVGHFAAPPLRPFFEGLTFGNPSAVMTASVLLTAPAVAALAGGSRASRIAAIAMVVLAGAVIIMSGSRAGIVAIGITVPIVGAIWLAAPARRSSLTSLARSRSARLVAVPLFVVAAAGALAAGPGLLLRASAGGEDIRMGFFAVSARMFQSSPLIGTGPGTWVVQRIAYTLPSETDYYIPHAHNIYLQTLAEFGIVGALAGLVVVIALARLLLEALQDADPARRRMGWVALFATVYFGAHQLLDFYANAPAILFAYAIPVAWLDATAPDGTRLTMPWPEWTWAKPKKLGFVGGCAGVAAIMASAAFLGWSENGALLVSNATNLQNDNKSADAIAPLKDAVRMDPAMPPYHLALGLALANTGDLGGAEGEFSMAAAMDSLPEAWLNLAAVQARLGKASAAKEALDKAMRLGAQQVALGIGAGVIDLQLGQVDAAVTRFSRALVLAPSLAGDSWWTSNPAMAAIWPNVYREAFNEAPPASRFVLSLEVGDSIAAANAIAEIDDPETAITDRLVLRAWDHDAIALALLRERARSRPLDSMVVAWCERLLRRSGDDEAAADYATWAATISGGDDYEIRVAIPGTSHSIAGINTLFYGQYTYRRPVTKSQLVEWLPELTYE
jgi:O-antigen ligase/Flp pilus assembly protein TadD